MSDTFSKLTHDYNMWTHASKPMGCRYKTINEKTTFLLIKLFKKVFVVKLPQKSSIACGIRPNTSYRVYSD